MSSHRLRVVILSLTLTSGGAAALACGSSDASDDGRSLGDDGGVGTLPDAGVGASDSGTPVATMRLAHLAADLGPVDFCYRTATSTSFEGPVLGGGLGDPQRDSGYAGGDNDAATGPNDAASDPNDAAADAAGSDAGAASISYRTVSRYLTLTASGPLTIGLVGPGSTSCTSPLFMADVTLDPGKLATVAIIGLAANDAGAGARGLVAFVDDNTTTADQARVRMVNVAFGSATMPDPGAALAVRAASGETLTLADRVEPRKAGSTSASIPIDALGYATISPLPSPAQLAVGAAADTSIDAAVDSWVSVAGELGLRGSSLHTGFILTGAQQPYEVLWCLDTSTSGDNTTCDVVR